MILSFVFMSQQGDQCQNPYCNVVSISTVGANTAKNQTHPWTLTNNKKKTIWPWLSILTSLLCTSPPEHRTEITITLHRLLHELTYPLMPVCHQCSSPLISTGQGVNQGVSLSWWPHVQNSPESCHSINLLWTSASSLQYCQALWRVYASETWYL